jgi:hypothetical protein
MKRFDFAARPGLSDALNAALQSRGYELDDFRLEEDRSSDLSSLLGVVGSVLKVRCCSTGEERIYSTGAGSAWLGIFLMDLGKGHFADAARSREPHALPPGGYLQQQAQHTQQPLHA